MEKGIIFVSHVHEDVELADAIKRWLTGKFSGSLDVFVASDPKSLPGGKDWWDRLRSHLKGAQLLLVLMTQRSLRRPWVYFECGGGYFLNKDVIPLCFGEITKSNLPLPLAHLQAYEMQEAKDANALFEQIRDEFTLTGEDDGKEIASALAQIEQELAQRSPPLETELQLQIEDVELSDADARNILETWLRKRPLRLNEEAIFYKQADNEASLVPGTSRRLLAEVAYSCGYEIAREGPQTILLKKRPKSHPLGGHRMSRDNLSQY